MLGDINAIIEDGNLGLSSSSGTGTHFKIGVSAIVSDVPLFINGSMNYVKIKEKLGLSPLADACIDSVENGASSIYCIPVTASIKGTLGTIIKAGKGTGTLLATGDPNNTFDIIIEIIESGTLNIATMRYSIDGGYSFNDEMTLALGGEVALEGTGIKLNFKAATEDIEKSFISGDRYTLTTVAPSLTNQDVLNAVNKLIHTSYQFEFVHIVGQSSKALWAALSSQADKFFSDYKKPLYFVLEGRNKTEDETLDQYVDAMLTERKGIASKYIQVVLANARYVRGDGREQDINLAGIVCGLYGISRVSQSIGEVKSYGISEAKLIKILPTGIEDYTDVLDTNRYLTFRRYEGIENYFVTNARMMAAESSDYRYAEDIRVSNKLVKLVRAKALMELQAEVDMSDPETSLSIIAEFLSEPVDDMVDEKEISSGIVTIDIDNQNILATEKIDVSIKYVPIGHIRSMDISFGMENPYRN